MGMEKNCMIKIHRDIIVADVLYGCETWSLILREERRVRVFKNRVLGTIFGPTREGVTVEWRKLHNEKLHDLYSSPNNVRLVKSRRMWWERHVVCMGKSRVVCRVLVRKHEGKRPLERPWCRWDINNKIDLQGVECGGVDWIELAQDRDR
jgi:hypothetical protein